MSNHPTPAKNAGLQADEKLSPGAVQFSDLISLIYRGVMENPPWLTFATAMRELLNAYPVALVIRPATRHQRAFIVVARKDNQGLTRDDMTHFGFFSPDVFDPIPEDRVVDVNQLMLASEWVASDFYQRWMEPFGIHHMLGVQIRGDDYSLCRLRVCRPPEAPPFSARERQICQAVVPHFKHALRMYTRINSMQLEQHFYTDTVTRQQVGTILMDMQGNVFRMNRIADSIVSQKDGLHFSREGLHATDPDSQTRLSTAIDNALQAVTGKRSFDESDFPAFIRLRRSSARADLHLSVTPLLSPDGLDEERRIGLALTVKDPEQKTLLAKDLSRQLFGLTPAESALAHTLCKGMTLSESAQTLGITKNTARVHLSSIFAKTGVTRQSSLVSLLMGSADLA